jgi:hypothetical protein
VPELWIGEAAAGLVPGWVLVLALREQVALAQFAEVREIVLGIGLAVEGVGDGPERAGVRSPDPVVEVAVGRTGKRRQWDERDRVIVNLARVDDDEDVVERPARMRAQGTAVVQVGRRPLVVDQEGVVEQVVGTVRRFERLVGLERAPKRHTSVSPAKRGRCPAVGWRRSIRFR